MTIYTDAATASVKFTTSGTESIAHTFIDADTVFLDLLPAFAYSDADTVYFDIRVEHACEVLLKPDIDLEFFEQKRWTYVASKKWSVEEERKWTEVVVESVVEVC